MALADAMALRSDCNRRQIGAVIVSKDNVILATGYNGAPAGYLDNCDTCPRFLGGDGGTQYTNCVYLHAEANSLMRSDWTARTGGTLYASSACCWECAKLIANSGLARVVHRVEKRDDYREPWRGEDLMSLSGLKVVRWPLT